MQVHSPAAVAKCNESCKPLTLSYYYLAESSQSAERTLSPPVPPCAPRPQPPGQRMECLDDVDGLFVGTAIAWTSAVILAIPVWQGRVSPVFDTSSRLLVVRRCRGRTVDRKEVVLAPMSTEALARSVAELGVDVLICAAISEPLHLSLERAGVTVETHLCGPVEDLLRAFHAGHWRQSEFRMPGCGESHGPLRLRRGRCRQKRRRRTEAAVQPLDYYA